MQKPTFTVLTFTIALLLFTSAGPCNAQRPSEHEIQLSYGPMSREQLLGDAFIIYLGSLFNEPLPRLDYSKSFAVTYRYQARRRVAIGVTSGFTNGASYKADYYDSNSYYKHRNFMMAFEMKFTYLDTPGVTIYAVTGLGLLAARIKDQRLQTDVKTYAWPTCQLTPFGVRFGKKLGGFAEIGYGYKGVLNMGISLRL